MANIKAEMPGMVCAISVTDGQQVEAGEIILILESMKMEIPIHAPVAGTVAILCGGVGSQVEEGSVIATVG